MNKTFTLSVERQTRHPGKCLARALHPKWAWRRKSRYTLKISIQESADETLIKLEGRVAGPWTAELGRVWVTTAPRLANRKLILDLRDITYADAGATKLLSEIYAHTHAQLIVGTVWTQSLAEQIMRGEAQSSHEEL